MEPGPYKLATMIINSQPWPAAALANRLDEFAGDPRFPRLCRLLLEANEKVNLTAVRDPLGVCVLHFADCLTLLPFIPEGARVVDVGCGGGFPSLPLAIARPDITVTALDSTEKKLRFVADAARELGLDNISTLYARAEDAGRDPALRESFDCAVSRAVAPLDVLAELCLPLVRTGGRLAAMKSRSADGELTAARPVISKLGGGEPEVRRLTLVFPDGERLLPSVSFADSGPERGPRRTEGPRGPWGIGAPSPQAGEGAALGNDAAEEKAASGRPSEREGELVRVIVTSDKLAHTPAEYPRHYSQIKKSHDKKVKKDKQNQ